MEWKKHLIHYALVPLPPPPLDKLRKAVCIAAEGPRKLVCPGYYTSGKQPSLGQGVEGHPVLEQVEDSLGHSSQFFTISEGCYHRMFKLVLKPLSK